MSELKTKLNDAKPEDFIKSVDGEQKQKDGFTLLEMFTRITGEQPKMWGASIIGFGQYHYKSERSSQEGDWPLIAFSPRKQNLTLYVMNDFANYDDILKNLGKHKTSRGCLYINKLTDVDLKVLEKMIATSYKDAKKHLT